MCRSEGEQALQHDTARHSFASAGTVEGIQISFASNDICNHDAKGEGIVPLNDRLPFLPVLIRDSLEHLANARKQRAPLNLRNYHNFELYIHAGFHGGAGGGGRGEQREERGEKG